jgi:hypothetical protein
MVELKQTNPILITSVHEDQNGKLTISQNIQFDEDCYTDLFEVEL